MSDVVKFDPSTIMDGVKDKIKSSFVELLPDEAFKEMVKKVVNDYFYSNTTDRWGNSQGTTFQYLVKSMLDDHCREMIKKELENVNSSDLKEQITKMCIEKAPEIFGAFLSSAIQNMIQQTSYQFQQR